MALGPGSSRRSRLRLGRAALYAIAVAAGAVGCGRGDREGAASARVDDVGELTGAAPAVDLGPIEVRCGSAPDAPLVDARVALAAAAPVTCTVAGSGRLSLIVTGPVGAKVSLDEQAVSIDGPAGARLELDLGPWLVSAPAGGLAALSLAPGQRPPPPARWSLSALERRVKVTRPGARDLELALSIGVTDWRRLARWVVDEATAGRAVPGAGASGVLFARSDEAGAGDVRRVGEPATLGDARFYAVAVEVARTAPRTCRYDAAGAARVSVEVVGITERVTVRDHAGREVATRVFGPGARGCAEIVVVPSRPPALVYPDSAAVARWLLGLGA